MIDLKRLFKSQKIWASYQYLSEIDKMNFAHYDYDGQHMTARWNRPVASENDVKGLIWLCRVFFEEKIIK